MGIQYLESDGETREEKAIDVKSIRSSTREYENMLTDWRRKARKENKVFCDRCVKRDFEKGELKETWEGYFEELEHQKTHDAFDKKTGKKIGIMVDYTCPADHGVCLVITGEEYKEYKELIGVNDIMKTGADRNLALKCYHYHKGNVVLATDMAKEELEKKGKPIAKKPEVKEDESSGKG